MSGKFSRADPPRRLSYSFRHVLLDHLRNEQPTKVVFNLEPHGKLVKLTLTHEDFEAGKQASGRHLPRDGPPSCPA